MKNVTKLKEILTEKLNLEIGIIDTSYLVYRFNKLYEEKHSNDNHKDFEEKMAYKFYIFGRYVGRYYIKKTPQVNYVTPL